MTVDTTGKLYCTNHPTRETYLRCNRCDKPICVECSVRTPTGYRCKECVNSQQKSFDTARPQDYIAAVLIAGLLAFLGSLITQFVGFFVLFLAPGVGWVIAEAVRKATSKRRSRPLFRVAAGAALAGSLANLLPLVLIMVLGGSPQVLLGLIWPVLYAALVCTTVYSRLSGIQLSR